MKTIKRKTITDTGHEGIGSSAGIVREYNPAVGTWTPVDATAPDKGQHTPDCCALVPESFCRECEPLARRLINENRRLLFESAALLEALKDCRRVMAANCRADNTSAALADVQARAAIAQSERRVS